MKNIQFRLGIYLHPSLLATSNNRYGLPSMNLIRSDGVAIEIPNGFDCKGEWIQYRTVWREAQPKSRSKIVKKSVHYAIYGTDGESTSPQNPNIFQTFVT